MVHWLRVCLPAQGTELQSLVGKIPHALEQLSLCARAVLWSPGATILKPAHLELRSAGSPHPRSLCTQLESSPSLMHLEKCAHTAVNTPCSCKQIKIKTRKLSDGSTTPLISGSTVPFGFLPLPQQAFAILFFISGDLTFTSDGLSSLIVLDPPRSFQAKAQLSFQNLVVVVCLFLVLYFSVFCVRPINWMLDLLGCFSDLLSVFYLFDFMFYYLKGILDYHTFLKNLIIF